MPHAVAAYGAGVVEAVNRDCPLFVGYNVLRGAYDARWTSGGTQGGTDITDSGSPARRAWDGRGTRATGFLGTGSTIYFNAEIPPSTIDTLAIIFAGSYPPATVTVQIADDGDFTTNVVNIAGPLTGETGCRIVRTPADGPRYEDVEFIRIRFSAEAGTFSTAIAPRIVEFFAGLGHPLSANWEPGSDQDPSRSKASDSEPQSGDRVRYPMHHGRHVAGHTHVLSETGVGGLDDVASVRAVNDDARGNTRPILYIPRPASIPRKALLGFPRPGLDIPHVDFDTYDYDFRFREQPPFFNLEECAGVDEEVVEIERVRSFFGPYAAPTGSAANYSGWGATILTNSDSRNTPSLATTSQAAGTPRVEISNTAVGGWSAVSGSGGVGLIGSGAAPGIGGFSVVLRFSLLSDPGGWRMLAGVKAGTGLFDIASQGPDDLTTLAFVAFGFPAADSAGANFRLYHSSGGGTVDSVDTGIPRNTTSVFQIWLRSARGSGSVQCEIADLANGALYLGNLSTNIPSASTVLYLVTSHRHPSSTSVGLAHVGSWTL